MSDRGRLFVVATPIGNLEDITLRALRVLREADVIAAEDTRRTRKLLSHYEIHTPLRSYHAHNLARTAPPLLATVAEGGRVALVTDSGLPGVSDPGREIVALAREQGLAVEIVPGPSAVVTAFVAAGFPGEGFLFVGYMPSRSGERRRVLEEIARTRRAVVAFEAPHRLRETLQALTGALGESRHVAVARELTKLHEEVFAGSPQEAEEHFAATDPRGEFTLVIGPATEGQDESSERASALSLARTLVELGLAPSEVARVVAAHTGIRRGEVYEHLLSLV